MSNIKRNAWQALVEEISNKYGICPEAADDLLEHIQELLYEFRGGMSAYPSEDAILADFGISSHLWWVFD